MKSAALLALLAAPGPPPPIAPGTYHCHTGRPPLELPLGDVFIAGDRYRLTGPQGHQTTGTYAAGPLGYRWSGDFGPVKHAQLADSEPDPAGGFVVRYALGHTSPVSIVCRR